MNQNRSTDTFLYVYSKYSKSCNQILPIIHQIAPSTGLIALDADNPKVRQYLLSLRVFQSVPCIILSFPGENRLEIYEKSDVIQLLNKILKMLNKPSVEEQLNLSSTSSTSIPSMRVPTAPVSKKSDTLGKTMLNFDSNSQAKVNVETSKKPVAVRIDDPFAEDREQQKLIDSDPGDAYKNSYQDRLSNPNLKIQKGEGHEKMKSSLSSGMTSIESDPIESVTSLSGTPIDMIDDYSSNDTGLLIEPTKMNYNDLVGPNGPPQNRELEAKQDKIKNAAAAMMSEREAIDSEFNKHKGQRG
jgi:hypothetical protein